MGGGGDDDDDDDDEDGGPPASPPPSPSGEMRATGKRVDDVANVVVVVVVSLGLGRRLLVDDVGHERR